MVNYILIKRNYKNYSDYILVPENDPKGYKEDTICDFPKHIEFIYKPFEVIGKLKRGRSLLYEVVENQEHRLILYSSLDEGHKNIWTFVRDLGGRPDSIKELGSVYF